MTVPRLNTWARNLGRVEKVFLAALVIYAAAAMVAPQSGSAALLAFVVYVLGLVVTVRLARTVIRKMIWRLRNRLIIAYLFIAVVPIVLIVALVGLTTYWITGQIAGYLVNSELNRRAAALRRPAEALARAPAARRPDFVRGMLPSLSASFPDLEILIQDGEEQRYPPEATLELPPPEWGEVHGVVERDGRIFVWSYATHENTKVLMGAPLSPEFLSNLLPGLGSVTLVARLDVLPPKPQPSSKAAIASKAVKLEEPLGTRRKSRVPPPYNSIDLVVTGYYPIPVWLWNAPNTTRTFVLLVDTRASAVLRLVFGHNTITEQMEWGQVIWWSFLIVSGLFLVVELIALIIGISITRTVTTAVHELYEGTQRVMSGDFTHRIPVRGKDQLAALGVSFNTMTANLERLIVVAKEKERLQSELEIAREVQGQLFPRNAPALRTLRVTGVCNPARMVSGDYYDFMCVQESRLAFAIGDVAGKGISAALLMAAIQSTMRTQLSAAMPVAAAAGNGGARAQLSTARLVSTLNKQLYANTSPEKYATFYFGVYDDESGALTYTNAGHLPPILVHDGEPSMLDVTGTVVGAFPFAEYEEGRVQLTGGDLLVAYTDGIVEPENEYGEMFGEQRLTELLVKYAASGEDEIIARTMEAVHDWTGAGELQDDMTMLVARRI